MLNHRDFLTLVTLGPLVSVDLIVHDPEGRVLVGLRQNEPAKDWWFVPGGSIRKGERLDEAFARICRNELGRPFSREQATLRGVYEHLYDANFAEVEGVGTHYVVLGYDLALDEPLGELPTNQHGRYLWLTPEEIVGRDDVHVNTRAYFV